MGCGDRMECRDPTGSDDPVGVLLGVDELEVGLALLEGGALCSFELHVQVS